MAPSRGESHRADALEDDDVLSGGSGDDDDEVDNHPDLDAPFRAGPPDDDEHDVLEDDDAGDADEPGARVLRTSEDEGEEGDDGVGGDGGSAEANKAEVKPPVLNGAKLPRIQWKAEGYVCFHFETTGGKKHNNTIISIAAVFVIKDGHLVGEPFSELVSTSRPIAQKAFEVHGITAADLTKAKGDFAVVGKLWMEWLVKVTCGCQKVSLVAHNGITSDFRLFAVDMATHGLKLPDTISWHFVDTLDVIRRTPSLDYHSSTLEDWPVRGKLTQKLRRAGKVHGPPSFTQECCVNFILKKRTKWAAAGPDGGRATFSSACGAAHDHPRWPQAGQGGGRNEAGLHAQA